MRSQDKALSANDPRRVHFQKGNRGRPRTERTTLAVEAFVDGKAQTLTRRCIEAAKGCARVAMRL